MIRPTNLLVLAFLLVLAILPMSPPAALAAPGAMRGIDANTATEVELDAIAGIGPALAARIVEERRKAPFASLDDLEQRVRGVGPASLRRMQEGGLVVGRSRTAGGAETFVGSGGPAQAPARRAPPSRP